MVVTHYRERRHENCVNVSGRKIWDHFDKPENMTLIELTEAYLDEAGQILFIYEPHIQNVSGSADVKLQAVDFKLYAWRKVLAQKGYRLVYTFILNDFFTQPKYKDVLDYIRWRGAIVEWEN